MNELLGIITTHPFVEKCDIRYAKSFAWYVEKLYHMYIDDIKIFSDLETMHYIHLLENAKTIEDVLLTPCLTKLDNVVLEIRQYLRSKK